MAKKKKNSKGYRRYKTDEHPAYDFAYDRALRESPILNPERRSKHLLENPKSSLKELEEESIPVFEQELKELEARFRNWARLQVQTGKTLEPPTDWPQELLELKLKKQALLDIRLREAAKLRKLIKQKEQEELEAKRGPILPHGPIGKGGGPKPQPNPYDKNPLWLIDGQRLQENEKGQGYIAEPTSPYNGMLLHDYLIMASEWFDKMGLDLDKLREEVEKDFQLRRKKAAEAGLEPPAKRGITARRLQKQKMEAIKKSDWPEVPKGSKIDELKAEA